MEITPHKPYYFFDLINQIEERVAITRELYRARNIKSGQFLASADNFDGGGLAIRPRPNQ